MRPPACAGRALSRRSATGARKRRPPPARRSGNRRRAVLRPWPDRGRRRRRPPESPPELPKDHGLDSDSGALSCLAARSTAGIPALARRPRTCRLPGRPRRSGPSDLPVAHARAARRDRGIARASRSSASEFELRLVGDVLRVDHVSVSLANGPGGAPATTSVNI